MMISNAHNLILANQRSSLRLVLNNLKTNRFIHSNYNVLRKQMIKFNVNPHINKFNKDSLISSHLSLFLRRNRFFSRKNPESKGPENIKIKVKPNELKRLLSLAKPDRYKIAGN